MWDTRDVRATDLLFSGLPELVTHHTGSGKIKKRDTSTEYFKTLDPHEPFLCLCIIVVSGIHDIVNDDAMLLAQVYLQIGSQSPGSRKAQLQRLLSLHIPKGWKCLRHSQTIFAHHSMHLSYRFSLQDCCFAWWCERSWLRPLCVSPAARTSGPECNKIVVLIPILPSSLLRSLPPVQSERHTSPALQRCSAASAGRARGAIWKPQKV